MSEGGKEAEKPKDIIREIEMLVKGWCHRDHAAGTECQFLWQKSGAVRVSFAQLLTEVEKIEGLERIRFMTSHPKDLSDELIEVMKHSKKICRHLHLPLQSGSSTDPEGYEPSLR